MSSLFDDLARTLATQMPRRRALRLLGSAVVVATVPGFRALPARAGAMVTQGECGGTTPKRCDNGKGTAICVPATTTCCFFDDAVVGCRQCYKCGPNSKLLPCIGSDELRCGQICCAEGEFCADRQQPLCCTKGANYCGVIGTPGSGQSGRGKGTCCPEGTKCCGNDKRTDCCGPGQGCKDGRCTCPKDKRVKCGKDCCDKTSEHCSNGKCCPKGKKNCGDGRCCDDENDCCEKMCCNGPGRICAGGKCCPAGRVFGSGKNARCCPPGTVVSGPATARTCCPKSDRSCCDDGEGLVVLCQKGKTCVRGICQTL